MRAIDVLHLGRERVICCFEVDGLLVDPGPESCLETLLAALDGAEPRGLLLTHIHLDHAGGAGALVRRFPDLPVYVHERGAPHLVDPSKLVASASRLYGDDMERLWGEVVPVPEANLRILSGGEEVDGFRVAYTPGHASHHVSYLHEDSRRAFVGDVGGVRLVGRADFTVAPTPPPDIDLEKWNASLSVVADWEPSSLCLTHFGEVTDPYAQLAAIRDRLAGWGTLAKMLDRDAFVDEIRTEIAAATDPETAAGYEQAAPAEQLWLGLDRYWRKREETAGEGEAAAG